MSMPPPPSPRSWRNRSPGDLSIEFPEVYATGIEPALCAAHDAARSWGRTPLDERIKALRDAQTALSAVEDEIARGITLETGKPLTEAQGEVGAFIAKIDLTITDAETHMTGRPVTDGPHPAKIRRLPTGPAVVIAPFNFPLHLGHGAIVAHLIAGNPVIFKPSPFAANIAARYSALMAAALPSGVFALVQGGREEAMALARDSRIRAVCFTGSVAAGRALALALAVDFSKELALELGGRNAAVICADADVALAAEAVADGLCLTCGQRCNATSRVLVDERVARDFEELLLASLQRYQPGDPMRLETKLGSLISRAAVDRYAALTGEHADWLQSGAIIETVGGRRGHYVKPAVRRGIADAAMEPFAPVLELESFTSLDDAVARTNATPFGLTASVFTRDQSLFAKLSDELHVGNIYANLPTTFSPGTLPFGGFGLSGNGRPGGRGFIRFTTREQALQWRNWP